MARYLCLFKHCLIMNTALVFSPNENKMYLNCPLLNTLLLKCSNKMFPSW